MTPEEYLDAARFPLTTQAGLDIEGQRMVDPFSYDDGWAAEEEGREHTAADRARQTELAQKVAAQKEVRRHLKARRNN